MPIMKPVYRINHGLTYLQNNVLYSSMSEKSSNVGRISFVAVGLLAVGTYLGSTRTSPDRAKSHDAATTAPALTDAGLVSKSRADVQAHVRAATRLDAQAHEDPAQKMSRILGDLWKLRNVNAQKGEPTSITAFLTSQDFSLDEARRVLAELIKQGDTTAYSFAMDLAEEVMTGIASNESLLSRLDGLYVGTDRLDAVTKHIEEQMGVPSASQNVVRRTAKIARIVSSRYDAEDAGDMSKVNDIDDQEVDFFALVAEELFSAENSDELIELFTKAYGGKDEIIKELDALFARYEERDMLPYTSKNLDTLRSLRDLLTTEK